MPGACSSPGARSTPGGTCGAGTSVGAEVEGASPPVSFGGFGVFPTGESRLDEPSCPVEFNGSPAPDDGAPETGPAAGARGSPGMADDGESPPPPPADPGESPVPPIVRSP